MYKIKSIVGREILDSRGNPTVGVEIELDGGIIGSASVPSGASTGSREALELRDSDPNRFNGKGVLKAVENINKKIAKILIDKDSRNQKELDELMIELSLAYLFKPSLSRNECNKPESSNLSKIR